VSGLLLDTHIFLWYASDTSDLRSEIRRQIDEERGHVFLSRVSAWEIAIKHGLNKLDLPQPIQDVLNLELHGIEHLELTLADCLAYSQLGLPVNHRDPFDRMLAVQAVQHDVCLVTADPVFKHYLSTNLQLVRSL